MDPRKIGFLTILGQKNPRNSTVGAGRRVGTAALPPPWGGAPTLGFSHYTKDCDHLGNFVMSVLVVGGVASPLKKFGIVAEPQGRRPLPPPRGVGLPCRPADRRRPCYFWDFFDPKWSKPPKNDPKMAKKCPKMAKKVTGVPKKIPN